MISEVCQAGEHNDLPVLVLRPQFYHVTAKAGMRPLVVIIQQELPHDISQLFVSRQNQMIQAFIFEGLDERFNIVILFRAVWPCSRSLVWRHNRDTRSAAFLLLRPRAVVFVGDQGPVPPQHGIRRPRASNERQKATVQRFSLSRHAPAFVIREVESVLR